MPNKNCVIKVREVGVCFAMVGEVRDMRGSVLHTTSEVPYGHSGSAYSRGVEWAEANGLRVVDPDEEI